MFHVCSYHARALKGREVSLTEAPSIGSVSSLPGSGEDRAVCNLYRMTKATAEIANLFGVRADLGANFGVEVYPGYPGLVIADSAARSMTWGFPRVLIGKRGLPLKPKPVNNAREDKLTSGFWRSSFGLRRCLIPVSAWAEAEGERGKMTRSWHSLPGGEPFAVAGIWRPTLAWGDAYSMVMADGCPPMADVHDRMPVILRQGEWAAWTDGPASVALPLCRPWQWELAIDRTAEPWAAAKANPSVPLL
jgi:putative SOS response-associated peptidase YedK